jgi:hypothetical protein
MEAARGRREAEHLELTSGEGLELVPLMKSQSTGRPGKDPATGYMMSHGLNSTDVTRKAAQAPGALDGGHKRKYFDSLSEQVSGDRPASSLCLTS